MNVAVDCRFAADGAVLVRQVELDGRWLAVEQGRQWQDEDGRHVLVMLPSQLVHELHLDPASLCWRLHPLRPPTVA